MAAASLELGSAQGEAFLRDVLTGGGVEEQLSVVDVLIDSRQSSAEALLRRAADVAGPVGEYARLVLASRAGDIRPLLAVAHESEDRESRALALDAAARACQRETTPSRWVRQAVATMQQALSDPEDVVRMSAARALGQVGTRADADPLVELLGDENVELRVISAIALLELHRVESPGAR